MEENIDQAKIDYFVLHQLTAPSFLEMIEITNFLHINLGENCDEKQAIQSSLEYAFNKNVGAGGFAILAKHNKKIVGACVVNTTAMQVYVPSNTLIYLAVDPEYRKNGIGTAIMKKSIPLCKGGLAIHVEPNNPARKLFEKLGFDYKYLEMRIDSKKK